MTRIAIVTSFPADPRRPAGGVQSVSVTLVEYLARTAPEVEWHVVTQDRGAAAASTVEWMGAKVHRLPEPRVAVLRNAVGPGRRQISEFLLALRPDLVHAHDTYGMMVNGLKLPAPRVFTVHGFIHKDTLVSGKRLPWLRARVWQRYEIAGWADKQHIISISPYVREFLTGRTRAIVHDIDNPIRENFFAIAPAPVPGRIFCAAEISPRKNTLVLVQALKRLLDNGVKAELRLAGKVAHDGYGRKLEAYIAQHGLQQAVVRLGPISYERVREELAAAALFALVSLEENSPMGIEEAMAASIPVVTSNRCGMPYMVRDGESGFLVDPEDPDNVAEHLRAVISSAALSQRMGEIGRQVAMERFHPEVVAARTMSVYRRALSRAGAAR